MLRNLDDALGKNILRDVFHRRGLAETEAEVPPGHAKRIDVWFVPDEQKRAESPPIAGVLAEITAEPAALEVWSEGLGVHEFRSSMTKRDLFHETLELRDKRAWGVPMLWHICAGKPDTVLSQFGYECADLAGVYRPSNPGWRVQIVLVNELPKVRDTLLLRLLGRGKVRHDALRELRALPEAAWEKQLARPWLVRLGLEAPFDEGVLPEEREFFMDIQAWYKDFIETHDRAVIEATTREVEARVLQQVEAQRAEERRRLEAQRAEERRLLEAQRAEERRQAELEPLVHMFERRLGRRLTSDEHMLVTSRVETHGSVHVADLVLDLSASELASLLDQDKPKKR